MSNLSPRTQLVVVGGMGLRGVTAQVSQYPYKYIYIYVCVCVYETVYYSRSEGQKKE
jgi:hypothetical protein